jgi:hypothetical protein
MLEPGAEVVVGWFGSAEIRGGKYRFEFGDRAVAAWKRRGKGAGGFVERVKVF